MSSCRACAWLALALSAAHAAPYVQSLASSDGANWTLTNTNGSLALPATVPGAAHLDLLAAGVTGEPYAELNVDLLSWVKHEPYWEWRCAFDAHAALLASQPVVELVAEGISAVAAVTLNGVQLWAQDDAFVRTVVDVTALVRARGNALAVRVASPTRAAAAANASCSAFCPSAAWGPPANASAYDQACNYVRKPGVDCGWDFAPNFNPSGVWRPLYLRASAGAALDAIAVATTPAALPVPLAGAAAWDAVVTVHVTAAARLAGAPASVDVAIPGLPGGAGAATAAALAPGDNALAVRLALPAALAWWPNGLGLPTLYNATVTLRAGGDVLTQEVRVGFRTVALNQPAIGGAGSDAALFFFSVNGHGIVVKGANWVPADAFATRVAGRAQLAPKLASFAAAHFNTLRVWGGGHPQPDAFYELAQEAGLLVWQEMPYACFGYPTGGGALRNAAAEAAGIARRLQRFSVLLWGGNNEVAQLQHAPVSSATLGNYSALFFGALGASVEAADATRAYVPTSPGSGRETPAAPAAAPPQTPARGDMHVYVYDGDCLDPTRYPSPRAASEFGWQSYSGLPSMAEVVGPAGFDFWSPPVQRRDTHGAQPPQTILFHNVGMNWLIPGYNGTGGSAPGERDARLGGRAAAAAAAARAAGATSTAYTRRRDGSYALPSDALGTVPMMSAYGGVGARAGTVFRDTLLLTQFAHAACLRTEGEAYRRGQSACDAAGGCTAAILYWMAADLWPGATKGSLEWSGRWKASHYEAARGFLTPLLLSPWTVPALPPAVAPFRVSLAAHAPAALAGGVPAGSLRLQCWAWASGLLGSAAWPLAVPAWPVAWGSAAAGGAVEVLNTTLGAALSACGCGAPSRSPAECVLVVEAFNASAPSAAALLAAAFLHPVPPRAIAGLRDPQLRVTDVAAVAGAPGAFDVTLAAGAPPAANVWLESLLCCGHWSDNNFLMTQAARVLRYTPGGDARGWAHAPPPGAELNVSEGQFAASLSVASLWDTAAYA